MAQMEEMKTVNEKEVPLSTILYSRDIQKLKSVVEEYEKCGQFTSEFYACLYIQCDEKKLDDGILKIMLGCRRFDVNKTQSNGETILHALVREHHYGWVQYLLEHFLKIDINVACKNGKTPFLLAAEYGHIDLLELLKSKVEDIHGCDIYKFNVLHWMATHGNLKWVKYLIEEKSFPVDQRNSYGDTSMNRATAMGMYEICQYLFKMGASASVIDKDGRTLLHTSVYGGNPNCLNIVLGHLYKEKFVNYKDNKGKTPLNWAAGKGRKEMVLSLLKANANVNIKDKNGQTALMWASRGGHEDIVKLLINAKADIDEGDKKNNTAITWAAALKHTGTVKILLSAGANINVRDGYGSSALDYAWNGNNTLLYYLLQHERLDVNSQNRTGDTLLMRAIKESNVNIVRALIGARADVNLQNALGETALILAAAYRELPCVVELVRNNADPNIRDESGETALAKAYQWRVNKDLVQILKRAGAVM